MGKIYETVALKIWDTTHWKAMIFEQRKQNEPHDCFSSLQGENLQATVQGGGI